MLKFDDLRAIVLSRAIVNRTARLLQFFVELKSVIQYEVGDVVCVYAVGGRVYAYRLADLCA